MKYRGKKNVEPIMQQSLTPVFTDVGAVVALLVRIMVCMPA